MLRLPASFGNQAEVDKLIAARAPAAERTQQLSEKDVINVLELVVNEYPVDRTARFLAGHSMGSGGTRYLGGKYPDYWWKADGSTSETRTLTYNSDTQRARTRFGPIRNPAAGPRPPQVRACRRAGAFACRRRRGLRSR